jgi:pimeloyl-ACP methyl ester carboxylesterase
MNTPTTVKAETLKVPGANIYYEVRGSGPVLLMMPGGPADAEAFRRIAGYLESDYTVVTYDPRGLSHSTLDAPVNDERIVQIFADDAHRLLSATSKEPAFVFASSGGATIALELAARHPDQVRTLVAHEPPSAILLPDPARVRAQSADIVEAIGDYEPDFDALKSGSSRIVPGVGKESQGELANEGGLGLAKRLGTEAVVFPGAHGGFDTNALEFAVKLREVLAT